MCAAASGELRRLTKCFHLQVQRLRSAVDAALLVELLESVDCGALARRLLERQSKQAAAPRSAVLAEPAVASVRDVEHLSDALVKELCRGEGRYEATRAAVEQLRRMPVEERMALVTCEYFPASDQVREAAATVARLESC